MPVSATIDGNSVQIEKGSLSTESRIEERSTAFFVVADTPGTGNYVRGMPVSILDPDSTQIFGGFIDTPGRTRQGVGSVLLHDISCMDNHYLADKRLVVKVYTSQTLKTIVEDIHADYLAAEGVTIGEVQTGPTIESAIFNYVHPSEAFDVLKEISGFTWYIDVDKKLYFIDRTTNAAAFNLDNVIYRPIKGSVHYSSGNPLYRNRQFIRGGTGLTAQQTENFTADGVLTAFTVGYPISTAPTVTEDAGAQTVGIKGIDTGKDYYWSKGDATVVAAVAPANTVDVEVIYYGEYPLIARADSVSAQADRLAVEGSGTGIVEEIVTERQHDTVAGIRESAKAKITEFAREGERFSYRITDAGLAPGTLQAITYSPDNLSAHEMLIESVSVSTRGENLVIYDVVCITGPSEGSWSKFFSGLLKRQDGAIKIGDGALIVLLQQSETLELTEVTVIYNDEFAVSGLVNRWLNAAPIDAGSLHNVEHERLEMTEVTSESTHLTEDYDWDDAGSKYGFATWA